MAKDMSNAEQVALETLLDTRVGSETLRDVLVRSALNKLMAISAEVSKQYIDLLLALSEDSGVDESEIGVHEARASHRKLVAVIARLRNSNQEYRFGK